MCKLFRKTAESYARNKQVKDKLAEFIKAKSENPQTIFGSKDRAFSREGNLSGYWHAGLNHDISVVYRITDTNGEKTLDLYGIFSHDELGTGTPSNANRQKSNGEKFKNQALS
jgi:mRNA-degrading endonuclease YafQ of YafQ-DinJ toxin-antitoxin module